MKYSFKKSDQFLNLAEAVIPLGSQTFSKSKTALPIGVSPFFIESGKGSKFKDIDGNEFIDFVNGLASVTLGYCDPDVNKAVQEQLRKGVTFSLSHTNEKKLAELIIDLIPCGEMVRFAKNGSDATSAAIRVARAYTNRDHVAVCGYAGWHDWYIGSTTRDLGVPNDVKKLTHKFPYNNIDALKKILKKHKGNIAAIMMEPMNSHWPNDRFLENVAHLAKSFGALLIFDETITGFRFNLSGAQKTFNITPDLATFGKGIANGFPLSALVGKKKYMKIVEKIFFSGTFGGEAVSIAAAISVINKYKKYNVISHLEKQGKKIIEGTTKLIKKYNLTNILSITGHPSWSFINFSQHNKISPLMIKTLFLQEVFSRGIYTLGTHNLSYAHSDQDIKKLLLCYDDVFPIISKALHGGNFNSFLRCKTLKPLFQVR